MTFNQRRDVRIEDGTERAGIAFVYRLPCTVRPLPIPSLIRSLIRTLASTATARVANTYPQSPAYWSVAPATAT